MLVTVRDRGGRFGVARYLVTRTGMGNRGNVHGKDGMTVNHPFTRERTFHGQPHFTMVDLADQKHERVLGNVTKSSHACTEKVGPNHCTVTLAFRRQMSTIWGGPTRRPEF